MQSHLTNLTPENSSLNQLYQTVRTFRETAQSNLTTLDSVILELNEKHQSDWLLRVELLEIFEKLSPQSMHATQLKKQLTDLAHQFPHLKDMINRGIEGARA